MAVQHDERRSVVERPSIGDDRVDRCRDARCRTSPIAKSDPTISRVSRLRLVGVTYGDDVLESGFGVGRLQ